MPGNRKPRKRYQPKPKDFDPMSLAFNRAALFDQSEQAEISVRSSTAFDALRRGAGARDAWQTVADALNIAEELAALGIVSNLADEIDVAQHGMAELMRRAQATGCWTMRAQELRTVDYALELYRLQLKLCSKGEHIQAEERARRRVAAALAGSARRGAEVITPPETAPAAPGPHPAHP